MSGFKVNFSVNNQLATPSIHAAPFAQRPAAGQPGRVFIDTDSPSTGIYRDTGTAWIQIASTSSPEADTLQTVTDRGNTTTNDIAIGTSSNPSAPLDVHGQDTIAILQATGTNDGFLQFNKSGSGKFKVGNVHNSGNDYFTVYNLQENSDAILVNISTNNVAIGGGVVAPSYRLDVQGSLRNTGNAYLATNESFVGIGTTSPATSLQISRVAGASLPVSLRMTNTAGSTNLTNNAGNTNLDAGGAAWTMTFSKVGSEVFRISASNNLLVGTTTDAGYKFRVNGGISCGSGGVIAGWDLHVAGTQRTDGNLLAAGGIQTNGITNAGSSITISCNSIVDRFLIFSDTAASVGNKNVFQFSTNVVSGITAGNSANIMKTTFSVGSIPTTGILNINNLTPTINQTTGTGTIYGFRFDPVNTAVLSKVYAFHSSSGNVNFSGLPTSSAGLASGDLWNDGGTLKIV